MDTKREGAMRPQIPLGPRQFGERVRYSHRLRRSVPPALCEMCGVPRLTQPGTEICLSCGFVAGLEKRL